LNVSEKCTGIPTGHEQSVHLSAAPLRRGAFAYAAGGGQGAPGISGRQPHDRRLGAHHRGAAVLHLGTEPQQCDPTAHCTKPTSHRSSARVTRPTRASQAHRVDSKRKHSQLKRTRGAGKSDPD